MCGHKSFPLFCLIKTPPLYSALSCTVIKMSSKVLILFNLILRLSLSKELIATMLMYCFMCSSKLYDHPVNGTFTMLCNAIFYKLLYPLYVILYGTSAKSGCNKSRQVFVSSIIITLSCIDNSGFPFISQFSLLYHMPHSSLFVFMYFSILTECQRSLYETL